MKQKVLVTGANGYIGKNVINYLLNIYNRWLIYLCKELR